MSAPLASAPDPAAPPRPRVVCLWSPAPALRAHLEGALAGAVDLVWPDPPGDDEGALLAAARAGADAFLGWKVGAALVEAAGPRLALVICPGAGVRHLAAPLAPRPDVVVLNSHGNADATAQHAVALLLALLGRIPQHDAWMRAGRWQTGDDEAKSWLLAGRTVGLLGLGEVGRRIARKLAGFEVALEGLTARPAERLRALGGLSLRRVYGPEGLDRLLDRASVLFVTLPHTPATEGLLGARELARLGPEGVVVSVGRGPVMDEGALYEALRSGAIRGAALDVWWRYRAEGAGSGVGEARHHPYDALAHPFHELSNVVLSPHRAASPFDDLGRWQDVIENLRLFAARGRAAPFPNRVDLARGY